MRHGFGRRSFVVFSSRGLRATALLRRTCETIQALLFFTDFVWPPSGPAPRTNTSTPRNHHFPSITTSHTPTKKFFVKLSSTPPRSFPRRSHPPPPPPHSSGLKTACSPSPSLPLLNHPQSFSFPGSRATSAGSSRARPAFCSLAQRTPAHPAVPFVSSAFSFLI